MQWVAGLEKLYASGVRSFVEVGPKRALKGFVDDVLGERDGVVSLFTNRPRPKELSAFNRALCGLYAAGYGQREAEPIVVSTPIQSATAAPVPPPVTTVATASADSVERLTRLLTQTVERLGAGPRAPYDRNQVPLGSIVVSGTGLGLPGVEKPVMDPTNAERILRGEQCVI